MDCSDTIDEDHKVEKSSDTEGFEDVSANLTSKVWGHFLLNKSEELAKCLHCSTLMKLESAKWFNKRYGNTGCGVLSSRVQN